MGVVGAETHQTLSGISAGDADILDTVIGLREANREGSGRGPGSGGSGVQGDPLAGPGAAGRARPAARLGRPHRRGVRTAEVPDPGRLAVPIRLGVRPAVAVPGPAATRL